MMAAAQASWLENTAVRILETRTSLKPYRWEVDQSIAMIAWGLWKFLPGDQMKYTSVGGYNVGNELIWGSALAIAGAARLYASTRLDLKWRWACALLSGCAWVAVLALSLHAEPLSGRTPLLAWMVLASFRSYLEIRAKARSRDRAA